MPAVAPVDFSTFSTIWRPRIEQALQTRVAERPGCPPRLREAMAYSLLDAGKRLRPLLTLAAAEVCGGSIERAMPAACAVEMVHCYSLVHDDLPAMDDDDLRRGRPASHKAFGEGLAILAGDALLTLSFETLAEIEPAATAAASVATLAQAAGRSGMVGGQVDDLAAAAQDWNVAKLQSIHERKTGALITASLRIGGLVAGAGLEPLSRLEAFGYSLGLAFQITDDLLDVCGSQQAAGKRVGKDAEGGKLTYPALLGVEESRRRAEGLVAQASRALAPWGAAAEPLTSLAQFVRERDR